MPQKITVKKIVRNSARCRMCKQEVESKSVHDFVTCPCGAIAVDGGHEHLRRIGPDSAFQETSLFEETV